MATFTGALIAEPTDFNVLLTEKALIETADDPEAPNALTALAWEDLTPEQVTALLTVINPIIADAEGTVNGYARAYGYTIPLLKDGVPDPVAKSYAVRLAVLSLKERRDLVTASEAREERSSILGELRQIQEGFRRLDVAMAPAVSGTPAAHVYGVLSEARKLSRTKLGDF